MSTLVATPSKPKNPILQANAARNRPGKGAITKTEPIRAPKDVANIRKLLADNPRNKCIFVLGTNTALRCCDILRLRIEQVKYLQPGEMFSIKEKKTKKTKDITINPLLHSCVQELLATMPNHNDGDFLFQSRKGKGKLSEPYLSNLVKEWCCAINLRGAYSSHTLRKTFCYMQYKHFGVPIATLMELMNHSSQKQTLTYMCIQATEIKDAYMNQI